MRRMLNPCLNRVLLAVCCALVLPAAATDVYRWTDDKGLVHYGQRPPPEGAKRLDLPAPATPPDRTRDSTPARRARQQRLLQSYEYERERKREEAAQAQRERQRLARRCGEYQRQWRRLSHAGPIYSSTADGGREYYSDEQREAAKARLRPAYVEACGEAPR